LEIHQQFWAFEVARRYPNVVFGLGVVKFGKTPIDEPELYASHQNEDKSQPKEPSYLSGLVVNHDVVWLDVAMHDALGMAKIKRLTLWLLRALILGVR
jgi:hypothetical protein